MPSKVSRNLTKICENIEGQKGVYTVLLTLGIHKILFPSQDIRYFQEKMKRGFSGRSIDTKYITPTLKQNGLPSMAESGWLTRSLEQPYPYLKNYKGRIQKVKYEFLEIVDFIQKHPEKAEAVVLNILKEAIILRDRHRVSIQPIKNPDKLSISIILSVLEQYLNENFSFAGGSKLPVIMFFSLYQVLIDEVDRYKGKNLKELASHTSPDSRSKSSGDIEISDTAGLFEAVEIKYEVEISSHIVNRAIEKIHIHNPKRYYILSTKYIAKKDYKEVRKKIAELKNNHGCQLIINGLIPTIKYYLRLLDKVDKFINRLSENIVNDTELKIEHKTKWKDLIKNLNS